MDNITLVINPGSSSRKYALFKEGKELLSVKFEHTRDGFGKCVEINAERQRCEDASETEFKDAFTETLVMAKKEGVLHDAQDVSIVALRIVSPGTFFQEHRLMNEDAVRYLRAMEAMAPLHIPHALEEFDACIRLMPHARIMGISDSAFHSTMPEHARRYSIPSQDAAKLDIYHFGYHGISVASCMRQAESLAGHVPERAVVCHIGSGVSITAVRGGKSIDTTMGFAPGDGLMMSSRAGDIDGGTLLYIMKAKSMGASEAELYMNTEGGFKGVLGQADLRIAFERMAKGDIAAKTAIEMFVYRIRKTIGGYHTILGGIDALILTATAAERNPTLRALVTSELKMLGIEIDADKNESLLGRPGEIQKEGSIAKIMVLHTNEMREMADIANSMNN